MTVKIKQPVRDNRGGKKQVIYDPPSGWQFGFPKPYKPLPEETFEETLTRDGYPARLLEIAKTATRFWRKTVWSEHHEMSCREIAEKIGCSERAVKQALSRAMAKLRDGRALKMKELGVARNQVARKESPKLVEGCIC